MEDVDLDHLVEACRQQDRAAQHALYRRVVDRVRGLVARMVGRDDVDDLIQEIFVHLFRSISSFRGESRFETWLYRLVVTQALQYRRRHRRWPLPSLEVDCPARDARPGSSQDDSELLSRALEALDPELRALFVLREVEGLSYRELAEVADIPEGTIGSRLNRARHELRRSMLALGWEE